jgi:hypothetical protein
MLWKMLLVVWFLCSFLLPINGQQEQKQNQKRQYRIIEVARFETEEGLKLPAKFLISLEADLQTQLKKAKFLEVVPEGRTPSHTDPALRITGTITTFKAGNRPTRYVIGFGAGKTRLVANFKVQERNTGQVLFESQADGKVVIGPFGGDTMGATNGLAKEIAKKIREKFSK